MKKKSLILMAVIAAVLSLAACKKQKSEPPKESTPESIVQSSEPEESSEEESSEPEFDEDSMPYGYEKIDGEWTYRLSTLGEFEYTIINNKCVLIHYTGTPGNSVTVPPTYTIDEKQYQVTLGAGCFKETGITHLTLPETVTEIPDSLCEKCQQLMEVRFSNVKTIGDKAFYGCENWKFQQADLNNGNPDLIESIGENAFTATGMYGKLVVKPTTKIKKGSYQYCQVEEVEIQSGITEIPDYCFAENPITKVTIPDTVTSIGRQAFSSTSLETIYVPKSVTELGYLWITTVNDYDWKYRGIMVGSKGSAAEEYAKENEITFTAID